jgi:MOSC domain-containing protein YiiM
VTVPPETCEACRFDGAQYDLRDTLGTLRALAPMWRQTTEGLADDVLTVRPAPSVWSACEYLSHSADVVADMGRVLHATLTVDDLELPDAPPTPTPEPEPFTAALARFEANVARLHRKAKSAGPARAVAWRRTARLPDQVVDAAWIVRHAVHDATHHLMDVGRGIHLLGAGAPTQEGTVAQLNVSDGGVPKKPIEVAEVGDRGLVGDRQASRQHHGRPLQALCLWSVEVIDGLRAEGHPIEPGLAGENVTIAGIEWPTLRPGTQLLIGDVLAEVSAWSTPCKKNAAWFADRDFGRMDHDRHPGWSRAYAWVREPGTIRQGDAVVIEP